MSLWFVVCGFKKIFVLARENGLMPSRAAISSEEKEPRKSIVSNTQQAVLLKNKQRPHHTCAKPH